MNSKSSTNMYTKEKKRSKTETKVVFISVIKLSLKYSVMSEGNTCIAEPNLEVLPLTYAIKDYFSFFLLKILDNDVRSDEIIGSIIGFAIR